MSEFPCPECGSKKRFHKKGCSVVIEKNIEKLSGLVNIVRDGGKSHWHCCMAPMRRTNGGPHDVMCRHHRLLTDDCQECRREHQGILVYECQECGRRVTDAPHLAQGNDEAIANHQVR